MLDGPTWIRGGVWEIHGDEIWLRGFEDLRQERVDRRFNVGPKVTEEDGLPADSEETKSRRAAYKRWHRATGAARRDPDAWRQHWGEPLGLTLYSLGSEEMLAALRSLQRFPELYREWDGSEPVPAGVADACCKFLASYGPLSYTQTFVSVPGRPAESLPLEMFELLERLAEIGETDRDLGRPNLAPDDIKKIRATVKRACGERWPDFEVAIGRNPGTDKLSIVAHPDTLESSLWTALLRKVGGAWPTCALCGASFTQPEGRHPPFRYCKPHREWKYRKRAARSGPESREVITLLRELKALLEELANVHVVERKHYTAFRRQHRNFVRVAKRRDKLVLDLNVDPTTVKPTTKEAELLLPSAIGNHGLRLTIQSRDALIEAKRLLRRAYEEARPGPRRTAGAK